MSEAKEARHATCRRGHIRESALGKLVVIDCIPKTERILFTAELGAMPGNTMESE